MSFEEEVRASLRRQADEVAPSPDAWERIEARLDGRGRPPWQALVLGGVAAAILVVAAALVVVRAGDDDDVQQVATAGSPSTTALDEPVTTTAPPPTTAAGDPTSTVPPTTGTTEVTEQTTTTTTAPPETTTTTAPPPTTSTTAPPPDGHPVVPAGARLTWDSLGPIAVGATVAELEAATGADFEEDYAYEDRSCGFARSDDLPDGVWVMIAHGFVERIDVLALAEDGTTVDQPITTDTGIGIGTPEDTVLATYPDATVEPHPYTGPEGHYVRVEHPGDEDPSLLMIFETDGERVTEFRAGHEEYVRLIEGCA